MTDFETKVLQVLDTVFQPTGKVQWYNGSLFVECSDIEAEVLVARCTSAFRCRVIATKAKTLQEWAFDFA